MSTLKVKDLASPTGTLEIESLSARVGQIHSPGSIVQMRFARSGPTSQVINGTTMQPVAGLSVNITPFFENSIFVIEAVISSNAIYVSNYSVYKNGSPTVSTFGFPTNTSSAPNQNVTSYFHNGTITDQFMYATPLMHQELAGLGNRTYQIYAGSFHGAARNLIINNRASLDMAAFSYMTVMEIAQ